jgi:hypothetical protein
MVKTGFLMFYDEVISSSDREKQNIASGKMSDAICESLKAYLWTVDLLHKEFLKSGKDIHIVPSLLVMEYAEIIDGVSILARMGSAKKLHPIDSQRFRTPAKYHVFSRAGRCVRRTLSRI